MSSRAQLACVPAQRRACAVDVLGGFVSLHVSRASVLALANAAADALADGHVGAARDLLAAVCSPEKAERILLDMLDDAPTVLAGYDRELVA